MSNLKIDPRYSEHLFRPIFELNSSMIWLSGAVCTPIVSSFYTDGTRLVEATAVSLAMVGVGIYYAYKASPLLKRQMKLTTNTKEFLTTSKLRVINQLHERNSESAKERKKDNRATYIGNGFRWGNEHANRAYQVMDMDSDFSQVKIPMILKHFIKRKVEDTESLGGAPWIHGMGDEKKQLIKEDNWYGHCCITGNVGTGKTTLLRLMSNNALHLGNVLIVLDPKNDGDWKRSIQAELKYLGMEDKFFHIHPSSPTTSCRMPILKNYTRLTEIADRIAPLMGSGDAGKSFQDFAFGIIYSTALALDYLSEPIRLKSIQRVISSDRRSLALRVLDKYFISQLGDDYIGLIGDELNAISPDRLVAMGSYYSGVLSKTQTNNPVEKMLEFALHDDSHYVKMVTSLRPILTTLTAEPLDELFSPIDDDVDDTRPIVDLAELMETGGCLYISLDSLTDGTTAGFLSRLILNEAAAVAGDRYNQEDDDPRRVTIANDEVHASIENNNALFNMLAQGRAASIQMILATQTISDIAAKTDQYSADRFLGLCNNFISMRTTDPATQKYVSEQFALASVSQQQIRTGTQRDTSSSLLDFSAGHQETLMKTREESFPPALLGDLPVLQYVARLADGKKLKMKLPILINDDEDDEVAPWLE